MIPTERNPIVTRLSCQDCPLWSAPVIGERPQYQKPQRAWLRASSHRYRKARSSMRPPWLMARVAPRSRLPQRNQEGTVHHTFQVRGESHAHIGETLLGEAR